MAGALPILRQMEQLRNGLNHEQMKQLQEQLRQFERQMEQWREQNPGNFV